MKGLIRNFFYLLKYTFGKPKVYRKGASKPKWKMFFELLYWWLNEGYFNSMYYAFGMNLKGVQSSQFLGKHSFLKRKEKEEKELKLKAGNDQLNYDVITKDKFYFNTILVGNNLPCLKNEGLIVHGNLIIAGKTYPVSELSKLFKEDIILKNIALEAGEGVIVMPYKNSMHWLDQVGFLESIENGTLKNYIWVVQKRYSSHPAIQKINSSALNTTRIVTVLGKNNLPKYLGGFQAFATNKATTDSWSHGSVYVGIDIENECLTGDGILSVHDKRGAIVSSHPDSGITFQNYPIPYLKEAVDLCIQAHQLLYFNYIIGWDIAITENGPLIVEANEKPGMNVVQCFVGGLKNKL